MTAQPERLLPFLKNQTFFGGLPDDALEALIRKSHTKNFSKNDAVCRRGEPGDSLMVILKGRVKISNTNAEAKEVVLNFLGVGDILGEIAALDGKDRTAHGVAMEDTEILSIASRDLRPALAAHPQALMEIIELLCDKLRAASAIIEDNTLDMQGRAAKGLLRLADQHGRVTKEGIRIEMPLSQDELGHYLGLSRANVSRQLGLLRVAGIIKVEASCIIIIDMGRLQEIAENSPE